MYIDEYYMRRAMRLALKARGETSPNPLVGAVLVKNGRIISEGFHKKAGAAHAEVVALDKAGEKANGATLYVTLEPCAHFGRTPPCVESIVKSGIKKIVVGMRDPNPLNNGKGLRRLRLYGITVKTGVLETELRRINLPFIKYITKRIPYVAVKAGMSLDGRIAAKTGDSKWITSSPARSYARKMRGEFDAIMVGINTVLRDNPNLSPGEPKGNFRKIILDSRLLTPLNANLFKDGYEVIIAASSGIAGRRLKKLQGKATVITVKEKNGYLDLGRLMRKLAKLEISGIFVEGGGELIGSLFDKRLVDKAMFFIAPKIIGGREAKSVVMGEGARYVKDAPRLTDVSWKKMGEDLLVEGDVVYS